MTELRTCLACGLEGPGVAMRIVEYADPVPVTVYRPVNHRENAVEVPVQVPGLYGAEWRCRDAAACRERAAALTPSPEPTQEAVAVAADAVPASEAVPEPSSTEGESWFD